MGKEQNKRVAKETLGILKKGCYVVNGIKFTIQNDLNKAINESKLYSPKDTDHFQSERFTNNNFATKIEVINEPSLYAIKSLNNEENLKVACLNFASAKNPGGGFLNGQMAQEESLAIASGLYPCISQMTEMYNYHRKNRNAFYTDYMIYSPNVPIIRDADHKLVEPYYCSFITSPAVNTGVIKQRMPEKMNEIEVVMKKRIEKILALALKNRDNAIILGAYGCGVFKNDPNDVATYFKEVIDIKFENQFKKIVFAVLDRSRGKENYNAFKNKFL